MPEKSCSNCSHMAVCGLRNALGGHINVMLEAQCLADQEGLDSAIQDMFAAQGRHCTKWTAIDLKVA